MTELDPFTQQLLDMIRKMPDDAILELVRTNLGVGSIAAGTTTTTAPARRTAAPKKGRRKARTRGDRAALLDRVEAFVRDSKGVGLSDVAEGLGESKSRIQSALRDLKKAGRVAAAGDRRFTRYAVDARTARAASKRARNGK